MHACSSESCPLAVRSDCQAWLEDVARQLPTLLIVIERDDDGKTPVQAELDGQPLALPQPSGPIEVLPGHHRLRFSLPPYADIEQDISVAKGEKNHFVPVRFLRQPAPQPAHVERRVPLPPRPTRPIPATTYVLAGTALAAFSISTALLVSALSAKEDAELCTPLCPSETRERIDTRLLLADVSGGIGLVLAGAAVYTFINRPVVSRERGPGAALPPLSMSGGMFSIRGRF